MSFQTGLSGLNAASRNLDVIGNNIANANTTGMKSSRVEFASLVAANLDTGSSASVAGIGVEVGAISQSFTQGNISITGSNLDVAINGSGFFQLKQQDGSAAYTRDGSFKLNKDGFLMNNSGANVMGYPTDPATGKPTSASIQPLQLPTSAPIGANATTAIVAEFNLDARAPLAAGVAAIPASAGPPAVAAQAAISPTPRTTYGTSMTAYDSQGTAVPVTLYFERATAGATDTWEVYDSTTATTPVATLTFDGDGKLTSPLPGATTLTIDTPSAATPSILATLDVSKVTQYGSNFSVSNLTQDGYAPGELVGLNIGQDGKITARYSNGETQTNGQLALADFRNAQGLMPGAGNIWIETFASGQPVQGSPGQGKLGALRSGALEESNVDLTGELVNMMTAQRAYQANAQTIKTQDQIMTTLVNLK
jgi:flagellar hook protein FlgE